MLKKNLMIHISGWTIPLSVSGDLDYPFKAAYVCVFVKDDKWFGGA